MTTMPSSVSSVTGRVSAVSTSTSAVSAGTVSVVVLHLAVSIVLAVLVRATPAWADPALVIDPLELLRGIQQERFDAIIDVRSVEEWNKGHIPSATLLPNLQLATEIPTELLGCDSDCGTRTIVVYCNSGARAGVAIARLYDLGFGGDPDRTTIYNGQGIVQWTQAGYDLVSTASVVPPPGCHQDECSRACTNDPNFRKNKKDCAAFLQTNKHTKCLKKKKTVVVADSCPAICKKQLCKCEDRKKPIQVTHRNPTTKKKKKHLVTCAQIKNKGWCKKKNTSKTYKLRDICPVSCGTPCLN